VKRRRFLPLVAAVPLGGCLDRSPLPVLDSLWLVNDRDEPHDATVTVEEDGDRLYERTFRLGTGDGDGRPANLTEESPVEGPGRYVVTARMDGERTIEVDAADVVDGDENCLTVRFTFLDNGSTDWWTKSYREC